MLWRLIFPQSGQRTGLTLSGLLLVVFAMGIGMAAYNSANNILFLSLSLLLACIILSGILSWLNFRGLRWRLDVGSRLRAGRDHAVTLGLRNDKWFLPSYGLWFELELSGSGETREVPMRGRLDAAEEIALECTFRPARRGRDTVRVTYVGSFFPFGFLRKTLAVDHAEEVIVWPAAVEYRRFPAETWQRIRVGDTSRRLGLEGDLLGLRRYQTSDSHRQIHWKASARLSQLMVRQNAAEAGNVFSIWVQLSPDLWTRSEQFELLCSLAATLAEDLFQAGRLQRAGVGNSPLLPIRRLGDLDRFFDQLALAVPATTDAEENREVSVTSSGRHPRNLITFAPDGARGVVAYVNGTKAAAA